MHQDLEKLELEKKEWNKSGPLMTGTKLWSFLDSNITCIGSPFRKSMTPMKNMTHSSLVVQNLEDAIMNLWDENTRLKSLFAYSKYAHVFADSKISVNKPTEREKNARSLVQNLVQFQLNVKVLDLKNENQKRCVNASMQCHDEYVRLDKLCSSLVLELT